MAKMLRSKASELSVWRRCLVPSKAGAGLPPQSWASTYRLVFVAEVCTVAYMYYKHVLWATLHLTVPTMLFNTLLFATVIMWVRVRGSDPGYIMTAPSKQSSSSSSQSSASGSEVSSSSSRDARGREVSSTLPQQFGVLKRLYDDALSCLPKAYGTLDAREGIVLPMRAVRCPHTDRVVLGFHGYCEWLGVAAGIRNARAIVGFSLMVLPLVLLWVRAR